MHLRQVNCLKHLVHMQESAGDIKLPGHKFLGSGADKGASSSPMRDERIDEMVNSVGKLINKVHKLEISVQHLEKSVQQLASCLESIHAMSPARPLPKYMIPVCRACPATAEHACA